MLNVNICTYWTVYIWEKHRLLFAWIVADMELNKQPSSWQLAASDRKRKWT